MKLYFQSFDLRLEASHFGVEPSQHLVEICVAWSETHCSFEKRVWFEVRVKLPHTASLAYSPALV